jgi:thiol-disulfide isomerase/thioredoxin
VVIKLLAVEFEMLRIVICAWVFFVVAFCHADLPPAFSDVTLDAAKKQVEGSEKVVVIKFTADWCPPCKAMDKTTWRDESVVKWVKDHGVALQVDVDKDQKTAQAYNIEAMPTMVMLRGGKEIARTVGYLKPDQMLSWMEGAATGKAADPTTDPNSTPMLRLMAQFNKGVEEKNHDAAVTAMRDMWGEANAKDSFRRVGLAQMLQANLALLANDSKEGKVAIGELRDRVEKKLKKGTRSGFGDLSDWLVFNTAIGDDERSLEWFDRVKSEDGASATFMETLGVLQPLLARNGRVADLAVAFPNATEALQPRYDTAKKSAKMLMKQSPETAEAQLLAFEYQGAQIYAGYVAAKRIKEANEIAEFLLQLRDTPTMRVQLVRQSVDAGSIGPGATLWLDEAEKAGQDVSDLRSRVTALQPK